MLLLLLLSPHSNPLFHLFEHGLQVCQWADSSSLGC
jgi:hypothetical protein